MAETKKNAETDINPVPLLTEQPLVDLSPQGAEFLNMLQNPANFDYTLGQIAETVCFIGTLIAQLSDTEKETALNLIVELSELRNNLKKLKKPV